MSVDKKYQVFVSSTYQDLQPERQEIMHALLELDCIPSGMEMFPAANEDQWSLIKGVIDDCDYYIVVIGGRYGSVGSQGISYTEMEYRYALEKGKPVIGFLHKDPSALPAKNCESSEAAREKLKEFRELAEKKMCKYWTTAQELGSVVSRSLVSLQKQHPGIGWVKGNQTLSKDASLEILSLRKRIEELESEINSSQTKGPKGTEDLAQGEDKFIINVKFDSETKADNQAWTWNDSVRVSWNVLFSELSPLMIHEAKTFELQNRFYELVAKRLKIEMPKKKSFEGHGNIRSVTPLIQDFETVLIQLSALGLITQSEKKNRSVNDKGTYWRLTPYGVSSMNRLRAIRKDDLA